MSFKTFLLKTFTWWNGSTWGLDLFTRRTGEKVGTDEFGNTYYEQSARHAHKSMLGRPRRWVTYKDAADPTKVGADWYGWLQHTYDTPPTQETYVPREWQKPHEANLTGTPFAYRPKGTALGDQPRQPTGGDYKPWTPGV